MLRQVNSLPARLLCCQHPFQQLSVTEPVVGLEVPGRLLSVPALAGPGKAAVSFKKPIPGQKVKTGGEWEQSLPDRVDLGVQARELTWESDLHPVGCDTSKGQRAQGPQC